MNAEEERREVVSKCEGERDSHVRGSRHDMNQGDCGVDGVFIDLQGEGAETVSYYAPYDWHVDHVCDVSSQGQHRILAF